MDASDRRAERAPELRENAGWHVREIAPTRPAIRGPILFLVVHGVRGARTEALGERGEYVPLPFRFVERGERAGAGTEGERRDHSRHP